MKSPTAADHGDRDTQQQLFELIDQVRGVAATIHQFARDHHDHERSDQLLSIAVGLAGIAEPGGHLTDGQPFAGDGWARLSPALGAEAVVRDVSGRILLCQRADNGRWCLPGGLVEVGESPSVAVLRELWEEAGVVGRTQRFLGVFNGPDWGTRSKVHVLHLSYEVLVEDSTPSPGVEMLATEYFDVAELPRDMHHGHRERIGRCQELLASGDAHHDPADARLLTLPMHQRPA